MLLEPTSIVLYVDNLAKTSQFYQDLSLDLDNNRLRVVALRNH